MANVICITVYTIQLVVGLAVNSYSLVYLLRERMALHNKNRMILLLIHLTCADLFVRKLLTLTSVTKFTKSDHLHKSQTNKTNFFQFLVILFSTGLTDYN